MKETATAAGCLTALPLAALLMLIVSSASAADNEPQRDIRLRRDAVEDQQIRSRQNREADQNRQSLLRDLDRRAIGEAPRRLEIPVMRGSCRPRIYGSKILNSC